MKSRHSLSRPTWTLSILDTVVVDMSAYLEVKLKNNTLASHSHHNPVYNTTYSDSQDNKVTEGWVHRQYSHASTKKLIVVPICAVAIYIIMIQSSKHTLQIKP